LIFFLKAKGVDQDKYGTQNDQIKYLFPKKSQNVIPPFGKKKHCNWS
jgi:hypothetical protein